MASDQIIAVASDALRGLVQAALAGGEAAMLGAPRGADPARGVWLHLFRISQPPATRTTPVIVMGGRRLRTELQLHLDYLVYAQADDPLEAHALLGTALTALANRSVLEDRSVRPLLSQPARLDTLQPGSLSVQWKAIELSLPDQAAVWQGTGVAQQAGLFWRADVAWRAGQ